MGMGHWVIGSLADASNLQCFSHFEKNATNTLLDVGRTTYAQGLDAETKCVFVLFLFFQFD